MPRPIADGLWAVETPLRFRGLELGRRMAVIRLSGGELLVHSPAQLTPELHRALDELGPVRFVVPASFLHGHLFMEQYRAAYPQARLFSAPGLPRRRPDLTFDGELGDSPDPAWAAALDQALFRAGRFITEVVFCHRASGTLLVGDLCWNVTPAMPPATRVWAGWRPRVAPTPAFRLAITDRAAARASLERILSWEFDRILIGHGEIVETGGRAALRGAYRRLLGSAGSARG
jgi:hypothetical protein